MNEKMVKILSAAAVIPAVACDWISINREGAISLNPNQPDPLADKTIPYPIKGRGTVYVSSKDYDYVMLPWNIGLVFWGLFGALVIINVLQKRIRDNRS